MLRYQLEVTFTGDVAGAMLEELRTSLGLRPRGRLSDDWDAEFGERELRPREDGWVLLTLYRDLEQEGWWSVVLEYDEAGEPLPPDEVDMWQQQIISAITRADCSVQEVKRPYRNLDRGGCSGFQAD